ncbi:MAG: lasso peptide biosynthesis protein [Candidatus Schekmanbacteria bacterium]|nr:lasso peptide biosynthesis protein [Candidatus Schekmanbacteria bacterium]
MLKTAIIKRNILYFLRINTEFIVRWQLAVYYNRLGYFFSPKLCALKDRMGKPANNRLFCRKTRQIMADTSTCREKTQAVFNYLKQKKGETFALPWLFPEEAWILPALDCKGFSVLMLEMLKHLGISSQLWIGIMAGNHEYTGHAWLVVQNETDDMVYDRKYRQGVSLTGYNPDCAYILTARII